MILITMAGASKRFSQQGFKQPKYMLPLWGGTVFDFVLKSFEHYFKTEKFIFAVRQNEDLISFVQSRIQLAGLLDYQIVPITHLTKGQAHTAFLALEKVAFTHDEELLIFNIDTLRPHFRMPDVLDISGWLETFRADGDHWSFVLPSTIMRDSVEKVVEKVRISDFCSTGAYWFDSANTFKDAYNSGKSEFSNLKEEFVAPLYNLIIRGGKKVAHSTKDAGIVLLCGTPAEYRNLLENPKFIQKYD